MVLVSRKIDYTKEALKALVALHGPREAARVSGIPYGTISRMCFKFQWKKATFRKPTNQVKDAADVIAEELSDAKESSTLNLARYTKSASQQAANHKNPLEVARKVRDVAGVYQSLWPPEGENDLIEGSILIGTQQVTDNPEEIMAQVKEKGDVRQELPGQRPAGH